MANLYEYLGAIAAHVSQARVLADLESAKIALAYADNDLLRHFSIPRFRIDDVELTVPVAVSELNITAARDAEPLDRKTITALTYAEMLTSFGLRALPAETADSIRTKIAAQVDRLAATIPAQQSDKPVLEYVANIVEIVDKKVRPLTDSGLPKDREGQTWPELAERFRRTLAQKLRTEVARGRVNRTLGNLQVVVESDKLREKNAHTLLMLKLKLSEEGMTWESFEDGDGNLVSKLMPA